MVNRFTVVRPDTPFSKILNLTDEMVAEKETASPAEATVSKNDTAQPSADRFQVEVFKAIETLGRKLERVEEERARLAARLAEIEAATMIDEATGRLYLPAVAGAGLPAVATGGETAQTQKGLRGTGVTLALGVSVVSVLTACFALGLVMLHRPQSGAGVVLSQEQLAALNALTEKHMAGLKPADTAAATPQPKEGAWQPLETFATADSSATASQPAIAPAVLPEAEAVKNAIIADGIAPDAAALNAANQKSPLQSAQLPPQLPASRIADKTVAVAPAAVAPRSSAADVLERAGFAPDSFAPDNAAPQKASAEDAPSENTVAADAAATSSVATAEPAPAPVVEAKPAPKVASAPAAYTQIERDDNLPPMLRKLEKRAFDGVAEAQHDLAAVYAAGKNVAQDYKRAAYWFARAADGGIANAHYNLGVMFQQGLGLDKDSQKAIGWYMSAADLGHPEAMYNLGIAYIDGVGVKQDVARGAEYFKRAAGAGVGQAAYNLGVLYESGFMGSPDVKQALHWYTEARKKKHPEAQAAITRLKKQSTAAAG